MIGCIDSSHIKIKSPKNNSNSYINRKGYHSVILQAVCDHRKVFTDVYIGEVGSVHDYTVFRKSDLYRSLQNGQINCNDHYMLGDLAYKLSSNLMVGFKDNGHLTEQEKLFNNLLSKKRVLIENAFALLKGRFRRIKFLETVRIDLIVLLIMTSCILHNLCLFNGDLPIDVINMEQELQEEAVNRPNNIRDIEEEQDAHEAIAQRNNIVNALHLYERH